GNAIEMRIVDAASPFSYFMTSESGGSAIVVWTVVAALLVLSEREQGQARRRALLLASLIAGLSYGFKAQMFLLMAPAYCAALMLPATSHPRGRRLAAVAITAAAAAAVFFSWRAPLTRGLPLLTPGLFARLYVFPALGPARLGVAGAWLTATLERLPSWLAD